MKEKRVLYVDIVSWHVGIHRMALIREAITKGYDVHVALPHAGREPALRALGSSIHKVALSRKGMEPFQEGWSIGELARLYRRLRPRLVHHLTLKPVLYGTLAATGARVPAVLNAVTGLGYLFDDHGPAFRAAREVAFRILRPALRRKNVYFLFQNADDRAEFERRGLAAPERTRLLPGSGVDVERFAPQSPPNGTPAVVLPARLLRPKGILEFVQAARLLRQEGVQARFILAGSPDPGNPLSVSPSDVRRWVDAGILEWPGWVRDMPGLLASCHIVCLPSYREGLPMTLLEAMAAGRPVVTTDAPGCRDAVTNGIHGLLVPPKDPEALARALRRLIENPELRLHMGAAGRERAVREFSSQRICDETLALYARILEETRSHL